MLKEKLSLLLLVSSLILSGCASIPKVQPNPNSKIRTIALPPMVNNTNDVDAPLFVRQQIASSLEKFFYQIHPLEQSDQLLKDRLGVTIGSQLDMVSPKLLCETLGTDGVLLGALEDFNHKITGVYNVKRVRIRSKLLNCKNGTVVWKNGIGVKQSSRAANSKSSDAKAVAITTAGTISALASVLSDDSDESLPKFLHEDIPAPWLELPEKTGSVASNAANGLVEKVAGKVTNSALKEETQTAVDVLLHGYYFDGDIITGPINYGVMIPVGPVVRVSTNK